MRGVQCFSLGVVTVEVLTNKQAEEIPRVEFSMSGRNKHAHMGGGREEAAPDARRRAGG